MAREKLMNILLNSQFQESKTGDFLNVLKMSLILLPTLGWLFVICYFGDEVTSHFDSINDAAYQCEWHSFNSKMQKHLQIMICTAQKAVYIGHFGQVHCTRGIYASV